MVMIIHWIFLVLVLWTVEGDITDLTSPTTEPTTEPLTTTTTTTIPSSTTASPTTEPSTSTTTVSSTTTEPSTTTTATLPVNRLSCYNCSCIGTTCPCTTFEISSADRTYCSITRQNYAQDIYINYGHININSTHVYIRDYPYVLLDESIIYDEITGRWNTYPERVIYGCNWDLCNKPEFLPYLPTSFQMRLPESWLNSSVLGTGQPVRDCHQCEDAPQCGTSDFLDASRCPIRPCNTTCLVSDTFDDPESDELCYQSFCAPTDDEEGFEIDTHRVNIEGILYASRPENVELWEIDIYCRADDCSRPEIFKELRENLVLQTGDLSILFNQTVEEPKIRCFDCSCEGEEDCGCDIVSTVNARSTYCTIVRNYDGENVYIYFSHLEIGSSYPNVRELPYVIANESIFYNNQTSGWSRRTNEIIYGCNWDYCNKQSLLPLLPSSFQMSLPDSWLNSNVLGTGQPVHNCHACANVSICSSNNTIDGNPCPVDSCNTTCFVSNTYSNPANNEQCYQSYCVSEDSEEFINDIYSVVIQGIVYASQPNDVELWEVYIYCRVDNCSRPEIFQEIQQELNVELGNLSALFNQTSIGDPGQLRCYDCSCIDDPNCACNKTLALPIGLTYCTVIRENDGQDFWIILEHIDRNSSLVYIPEFPFLLVDETITYNDATGQWITIPYLIVYGCNTDFCNDPRLVPRLPNTFQMRLSETWLNSNILGTGQPQRDCHECPDAPQCGTSDFLDASRCPIRPCNTTCLVIDTFDDPESDELCYQSYCLAPDSYDYEINRRGVEIEGIIYGNRLNAQLELWEIDIYCQADDCSRPEIFKELEAQLTIDSGDLSAFFNTTTTVIKTTTTTTTTTTIGPQIICYDCYCDDNPNCACETYAEADADSSYCTIIRQNFGDEDFFIALEHVRRNSTHVYIREFPYLLVEESIIYDEQTKRWNTKTNLISYGCNWNYCNHPRYVPYLPDSFQMRMSEIWLNQNVLGTGQPVRDCHHCPNTVVCSTTDFIDGNLCPIQSCNTTCFVQDTYDNPDGSGQCYQSYCAPPDSEFFTIDPHRVEMEGILYLYPIGRPVELWEVDIFCRADDCSRPTIFNEIKNQFTVVLGDLNIFYNITTTTGSGGTTTTVTGSTTVSSGTTTQPGATTTTRSTGASTYMAHVILILIFLLISLINLY